MVNSCGSLAAWWFPGTHRSGSTSEQCDMFPRDMDEKGLVIGRKRTTLFQRKVPGSNNKVHSMVGPKIPRRTRIPKPLYRTPLFKTLIPFL